jgi:hypothetical protein
MCNLAAADLGSEEQQDLLVDHPEVFRLFFRFLPFLKITLLRSGVHAYVCGMLN